jgi:hypothetical protein
MSGLYSYMMPIIITTFVITHNIAFASQYVEFDADGTSHTIVDGHEQKAYKRLNLATGNIQTSAKNNDCLVYFDGTILKKINLKLGEVWNLIDLKRFLSPNSLPWYIAEIAGSDVVFSVHENITSKDSGRVGVSIYKLNLNSRMVTKMELDDVKTAYFSINGSDIFYTNNNGNIVAFKVGYKYILNVKGLNPIVSPKGDRIAYVHKGALFDSLNVYDVKTSTSEKIMSLPMFMQAETIIRWSKDERRLLVGSKSDFRSPVVFDIDIAKKTAVKRKSNAVNWFYTD